MQNATARAARDSARQTLLDGDRISLEALTLGHRIEKQSQAEKRRDQARRRKVRAQAVKDVQSGVFVGPHRIGGLSDQDGGKVEVEYDTGARTWIPEEHVKFFGDLTIPERAAAIDDRVSELA